MTEPGMTRSSSVPGPQQVLQSIDFRIYVVGIVMFGLLMAFASRYGFHRDELYFLDCARHLSAAYVDQPVFTPLVAWVSLHIFGVSVVGLRLWAALAAFASVVVGALLAREFGGGRFAQLLGALGVATAPAYLGSDHLLETTSFDLLLWPALALVLVRIGRTGNLRLFVPAGLILGVGLANKHSIGFFALAIIVGLMLSGGVRLLLNRWCLAGLVVALACTLPDLWWQATHGWATIDMTRSLAQENGGLGNAVSFLFAQLSLASPVLIPVWLLGLRALWRSEIPIWRALAWAYGLLLVFFALTSGAKPYYVAALYPILIAPGAVVLEQRWSSLGVPSRTGRIRWLFVGLALSVLLTLPITLPVLPARTAGAFNGINTVPAETVGWPDLVQSVTTVWHSLPSHQRANAVIFTSNYGEAGAINELGRSEGLPTAVSGHNSEWFWGPGNPRATTVVAVVLARQNSSAPVRSFTGDFTTCRVAATIHNVEGVTNQEEDGHIYVCTGLRREWGTLWPSLRHYD